MQKSNAGLALCYSVFRGLWLQKILSLSFWIINFNYTLKCLFGSRRPWERRKSGGKKFFNLFRDVKCEVRPLSAATPVSSTPLHQMTCACTENGHFQQCARAPLNRYAHALHLTYTSQFACFTCGYSLIINKSSIFKPFQHFLLDVICCVAPAPH